MLEFKIEPNYAEFQKGLLEWQRKQVPFALSQTINSTLFSVRKHIVNRTFKRAFDVKNKRFPSATWRVEKATKRKLNGRLYDFLTNANLQLHEEGGLKKPRGNHIAIPQEQKRLKSGRVPKGKTPREILKQKRYFYAKMPSGKKGIWKRITKKRLPIRLIYSFTEQAKIEKRFPFHRDANKVAERTYRRHFEIAFAKALRTARRRY
jgi:hypothetical protein